MKKHVLYVLVIALIAIFSFCSPPPHNGVFLEPPAAPVSVALVPGDVVDVKFYYTPEINESQTVRPDGKISLQLLGDVDVEGKTTEQLRQELIKAYTQHLKDPDVTVILRTMYERRIYVGGEVNHPGMFSMPGSITVLEAIMVAGGLNSASAKAQDVIIIRYANGKWIGTSVNVDQALKGNEVSLLILQPRDIVFVPRTSISHVDQWVDQYINKVIPNIVTSFFGASGNWTPLLK